MPILNSDESASAENGTSEEVKFRGPAIAWFIASGGLGLLILLAWQIGIFRQFAFHVPAYTVVLVLGFSFVIWLLGTGVLARQRHLNSIRRELLLERQHREAERKFRTLFESSRDAIIILDRATFLDCNGAALELFGFTKKAEILAKHPGEFTPPAQHESTHPRIKLRDHIEAAYAHGSEFFEWPLQRKDGTVFHAEVKYSRIEIGGEKVLQAMVRDITERKRAEAALFEISDREQARLGQDLHDGLCQDLATIAMAANSLFQRLSGRGAPECADTQKIIASLNQAVIQARSTARGLFPVELEAEGLAFALESLALKTSQRAGLSCELVYPEPVLIHDNSTAIQLYRIAQEAVNNAIKHAKPRHIVVRLSSDGSQVELAISDDGVGIASPLPIHQSGMGLNIMKYRAKTIGGTLQIAPRNEGGTKVCCFVSAKQSPTEGRSAPHTGFQR